MKELSYCSPPNLGWLVGRLDDEEMDFLRSAIEKGGEDHKSSLAGNLSRSYTLKDEGDWFFKRVLILLIETYSNVFTDLGSIVPVSKSIPYHLSSFWCNFQKQGEFNPTHDHTGIYSFAIWVKNPVRYEDQAKLPLAKGSNTPVVSSFQFHYLTLVGRSEDYTYPQSPEQEGTILFFPSSLRHSVFPFFNSEEERVSISGNISLLPN